MSPSGSSYMGAFVSPYSGSLHLDVMYRHACLMHEVVEHCDRVSWKRRGPSMLQLQRKPAM